MAKKKDKTYRAGAYKRLSQDDGRGEVSNSIINQTELIKVYGKSHSDIEIVAEYDDDGYSGTNFDRPGFLRMMEDIKAKKIDCVIVKDLSRFGRNYIEVGKYIERIFPFMGVRFISINDNYDSKGKKEESDSLMLPFKNLVNDAYCRDISVKIRSQLDIKRKKGECISAFAVYGYQKSQKDKNRLEVDVYAAEIVQTIFRMKLQGSNQQRIADFLNDNGVLSPLEYKKSIGLKYSTSFKIHPVALWSVNAINRILTEEAYTGVMAQGKTSTPNYKVKTQIVEFVDDGYSGTNFNRPAFRKMMEEVKRGKIQCIMVKDFSRFARNFLDAGEYLEQIFPFLGVRFISVNDHYDSDTKEGTAGDWDVVFKNFLYDLYSKDLSKKTTAAKRSKARKGEYLGRAPIGYVRSKERKNQLEIEPEGAKIVRFIFDMALSGHTIPEIVKMLNQAAIPTPGTLTEKNYKGKQMMVRKNTTVVCWQYNMVWGILKNRVYTGACVNFKRSKTAPCGTHTKKNELEEQVIVPDCHEAIVTEKEFEQAFEQCRIMKGKRNKKDNQYRPRRTVLSGFCVCGYCNRTMQYEYRKSLPDIFYCQTTRYADVPVDENTCDCRQYEVDRINASVLKAIKQIGELAERKYCIVKRDNSGQKEAATKLEREIGQLRQRVLQKKTEKQDCYERYIMEEADRNQYLAVKQACDAEIEAAEKKIAELSKEMEMQAEVDDEQLKELENISLFAREPALTKEMVEAMIKEVRVYRDDRYEIKWKFKNVFDEVACP